MDPLTYDRFPNPTNHHQLRSMQDYLDFFVAEMKHPTFIQSIIAEWWATTLFLFFLILSVLPGANGGQEIFRIGVVAVRPRTEAGWLAE